MTPTAGARRRVGRRRHQRHDPVRAAWLERQIGIAPNDVGVRPLQRLHVIDPGRVRASSASFCFISSPAAAAATCAWSLRRDLRALAPCRRSARCEASPAARPMAPSRRRLEPDRRISATLIEITDGARVGRTGQRHLRRRPNRCRRRRLLLLASAGLANSIVEAIAVSRIAEARIFTPSCFPVVGSKCLLCRNSQIASIPCRDNGDTGSSQTQALDGSRG